MTVREVLLAAREAAVELRRIDEEAKLKREAIGVQGHGYESHSKVGVRDPMRKCDELLDWEVAQKSMPDITGPIDEAWDVVSGIERVTDPATLEVVNRYYLQGESWREIIDGYRTSYNTVTPISERMKALAEMSRSEQFRELPKYIDCAIAQWEAYGIAHLKEMGRLDG